MKVRLGFVTNSSSSSFIVARKDYVNENRLSAIISSNRQLNSILNDRRYYELPPEIEKAENDGDRKLAIDLLTKYITNELLDMGTDLVLDDWRVTAGEATNDSSSVIDGFIYGSPSITLDDFKMTTVW